MCNETAVEIVDVRVVYATVCERCESIISETVSVLPSDKAEEKLKSEKGSFFKYNDRTHNAQFRSLISDTCRTC